MTFIRLSTVSALALALSLSAGAAMAGTAQAAGPTPMVGGDPLPGPSQPELSQAPGLDECPKFKQPEKDCVIRDFSTFLHMRQHKPKADQNTAWADYRAWQDWWQSQLRE